MTFTALNRLAEKSSLACTAAGRKRKQFMELGGTQRAEMLGYHEGQSAAFTEAHKIMKAEIARLRNRFQNGALSMDDCPTSAPMRQKWFN